MQKVPICFRKPEDITKFVDIINRYEYDADLKSGKNIVDAKSILGVIAISRAQGVELLVHSEQCSDLFEELQDFIRERKIA